MTPSRPLPASVWVPARSVSKPAFVPATSDVSFVVKMGGPASLALVRSDGGPERHLALDPAIAGEYAWLPDGSGLVFVGGDGRLHRHDMATASTIPLTEEAEDISGLTVSAAGDLAFCVDMARVEVWRATGERTVVADTADFYADPAWSPDGASLAWVEWDVPAMAWDASRLMVCDVGGSGQTRTVDGGDGVAVQQPQFSSSGARLGYLCDRNGWMNLWSVDGKTFDDARVVVAQQSEHGGPLWGSGSRTWTWCGDGAVAIDGNEQGWQVLTLHDAAAGTELQRSHFGMSSLGFHDGVVLGSSYGAARPAAITALHLDTQTVTTIAQSTAETVWDHGVEPELVMWASGDGATVYGRLYKPVERTEPAPLLVWLHGGPTDQSTVSLHHRLGYFVDRGWALLAMDYRGSSGWGREYQQALRGNWGVTDVADTIAGAEALAASGIVDAQRIVLWGGSAGGFTGLNALAERPDLFAAGVFMYPVSELADLQETHRLEAHYNDTLVGPWPEARRAYEERSVSARVHRIKAPVLLLHGDSDPVVPLAGTQRLAKALEANDVPVELHVYEGEKHGWRSRETRIDELMRMESFLHRTVLIEDLNKGEDQ